MYPYSEVLFEQVLNHGAFFSWTVIMRSPALSVCLINFHSQLIQHHPSSLPIITKSSRLKRLQPPNTTRRQEEESQLIL